MTLPSRFLAPILTVGFAAACASPSTQGQSQAGVGEMPSGISNQALRPTSSEGVINARGDSAVANNSAGENKRDLQALLQLFAKRQWGELESRSLRLVKQLEHNATTPGQKSSLNAAQNLHGMALLFLNRAAEAEPFFQKAYRNEDDINVRPYYGYNLASASAELQKWTETRQLIDSLRQAEFDRTTRVKVLALRARALAGTQAHPEAARAWLELQGVAGEMLDPQLIREKLAFSLEQIQDAVLLDALVQDFYLSKFGDELLWRLAEIKSANQETDAAKKLLETLIEKFPQSPHAGDAHARLRGNSGTAEVTSKKVGALLPLSGKLARFGRKALQSLQLALGIYAPTDEQPDLKNKLKGPESDWTLYIEDAGEDETSALQALQKLAEAHGVSAVVGPISSKGIDALSKKADELGIPLITLSQQPPKEATWTLNAGLTAESQTREIVRYAMQTLKLKRFAIIHSRDRFGEEYARLFWDAVDDEGGEIRGIEAYSPGETDFRSVVEKLGGLAWPEARTREIKALEAERGQLGITKRTMKTEKYYALPPIVDFDAVFIADEPRVAAQIIPTFAYRDINGVRFLGSATWNSPELYARAQAQAEGALFPDVFYVNDPSSNGSLAASRFRSDFRTTFNQEPQAVDAMAYDVGILLKNVLNGLPASVRRSEIRSRLQTPGEFSGAAGKLLINDTGVWSRKLQILEIRGGRITLAQ
jgi:branched-chain amino acid transport system substrate-binding protein